MRRLPSSLVLAALVSTGVFSTTALAQEAAPDSEHRSAFKSAGGLMDRSDQTRQQMLSFFVGLASYSWGPSLGARYYFPIVANGFIPSLNDEFALEAGVDAALGFYYRFGLLLDIPIEAVWRFHFTDKFSAYAKVGVALELDFSGYRCNGYSGVCGTVWFNPVGQAGVVWKLNDSISLRGEVGYPAVVKIGVGIGL
jgi:hypothetical protein